MFKKILLSVDLNDAHSWEHSLPKAIGLAEAFGCELHILTVVPELPADVVELYLAPHTGEKLVTAAIDGIKSFIAAHVPEAVEAHPHAAQGSVYSSILDTAERLDVDLIIMASHRPDMSDYLLGPNAARVVRHSTRSVLVVRQG